MKFSNFFAAVASTFAVSAVSATLVMAQSVPLQIPGAVGAPCSVTTTPGGPNVKGAVTAPGGVLHCDSNAKPKLRKNNKKAVKKTAFGLGRIFASATTDRPVNGGELPRRVDTTRA